MAQVARKLYDAGYRDLVSVIPPDAAMSPNSRIKLDQRGKVPGLHGVRGWYGYKWDANTDENLPERIDRHGANIGLRAHRFPGLDLDTEDPGLTRVVSNIANEILGPAPVRFSREPRRLLMYRTDAPFPKRAAVIQYKGASHVVEMLSSGQQYLVYGRHPSGIDYRWEGFLNDPSKLTPVTEEKVDAFFRVLATRLGERGVEVEIITSGRKVGPAAPVPDEVKAGARNATLVSIAGTLRSRNIGEEAARAALRSENESRCKPPLPLDEVDSIIASVYGNYAAGAGITAIPANEEFSADPTAAPVEAPGLALSRVGDVVQEEDEDMKWLVDGLIHGYGSSLLVAKPKVGKSTFARALAVAVARGEPFLGREVTQGPVVYLLFLGEGNRDEWRREMRLLGATDDLPIYLYDERRDRSNNVIEDLKVTVEEIKPRLVIVDTMQNILKAKDLNDYAVVAEQFGPILQSGAHLMLIHHAGKGEKVDLGDAAIGSTKIFGSVEVGLHLMRDGRTPGSPRYLEALGRGVELEPHVVRLDPDTHLVEMGEPRGTPRGPNHREEILALLAEVGGEFPLRDLTETIRGRRADIEVAARRLAVAGVIEMIGEGVRGDPLRCKLVGPQDEFAAAPLGGEDADDTSVSGGDDE